MTLDVHEVGSELMLGGIEEWEGGKRELMFSRENKFLKIYNQFLMLSCIYGRHKFANSSKEPFPS